ncbi:hypothetical protein Q8F55_002407 [Vanrija albida]|uniref:DNA polymerase kappa n=1 Tax=Vanrija albida TaxID=181172 RepID=A0ABR3QAK5_9TREE
MDTRPKVEDMTEDERAAAERQQKSFERTLAGASVGKAGLLRDQTEVNRIIAEASKGSKFYNRQVLKDKELTEKIEWFKAKRDEIVKEAQLDRLTAEADKILVEVEATRDLSQTIVHVDMDAFYAAVEVQRDPTLKGKAFGVGYGVLCTASYEARKFGCRSGMAGFIAKKLCPHIIFTELHFDLYTAASTKVRDVLKGYDPTLMMAGLDEGYLNITPYMKEHNMTAWDVVAQLRAEVEAATDLTISAGIAPNRMLAKICSDKNKPNGAYELPFDRATVTAFMRDLPVRKIPGFGRVTERCLEGLGVETCGQVYERRAELLAMDHWFGFRGLCKAYLGIASNVVEPYKREERKSVGVERTFRDKSDDAEILAELESIAEELEKDLSTLQYSGKTVTLKYKLHTYENKTRALSLKKFVNTKDEILPIALDLMRKELPVQVRLLGIRLSNLKDLTLPDKGIKTFFSSKATADEPQSSRHAASETIDLSLLDEDEDEEEQNLIEDDFKQPVDEPDGDAHRATPGSSPVPDQDPEHILGPVCPLCQKALGPGTSNAELNRHVDLCLNRDALGASSLSPKPKRPSTGGTDTRPEGSKRRRQANPKAAGGMMDWLKRAN